MWELYTGLTVQIQKESRRSKASIVASATAEPLKLQITMAGTHTSRHSKASIAANATAAPPIYRLQITMVGTHKRADALRRQLWQAQQQNVQITMAETHTRESTLQGVNCSFFFTHRAVVKARKAFFSERWEATKAEENSKVCTSWGPSRVRNHVQV